MLRYGHSAADNVTDRERGDKGERRRFTAHIKQLSSGTAENYVTGAHAAMPCPLYRVTQPCIMQFLFHLPRWAVCVCIIIILY